jgi:hypothetical protein
MTLKAREVLRDCELLLADLNNEPQSELWRLRWVGLVVLLRAIGHVLNKVDREVNPEGRIVIDNAWEELRGSKPEPKIFWKFIEDERNNILKAYNFGPRTNITVRPGTILVNQVTRKISSLPSSPTTFEHIMSSGAFKGKDSLQLCSEAITFWEEYLSCIDRRIAEQQSKT